MAKIQPDLLAMIVAPSELVQTLDLVGPVDSSMLAAALSVRLRFTDEGAPVPLVVRLSTEGGDVFAALGIYDHFRSLSAQGTPIIMVATGYCMSAGPLIMQAGDVRVSTPNCTWMLHGGEEHIGGSSKDVAAWQLYLRRVNKLLYKTIADRTGQSVEYWRDKLHCDVVITAKQALAEKLIDYIAA